MRKDKSAIVVNLFGSPGAGKSTGAAYIFYKLKQTGINVELVTEFAKDKVWEQNPEVFAHQEYIFGKQSFKIGRCADKVDVIVTDSPLPLSILYNQDKVLTENFNNAVMDVFNSYDNMNFLIHRTKKYNPVGRMQSEEESNELVSPLVDLLNDRRIEYIDVNGDEDGYDQVFSKILERISRDV